MANKEYLDYAGLRLYDENIKDYIATHGGDTSDLESRIGALAESLNTTILEQGVQNNDITVLKNLVGNTAVADQITTAIADVVDSAPTTFDTLKEVATWIENEGTAATNLISVVAEQGQKIAEVEAKVDGIQTISDTYIEALFLEPRTLNEGQTVQQAIDGLALTEGLKLVLTDDVDEDLNITNNAVIEAEGVTFTGAVTVDEGAKVTVIGANFTGPVTVAHLV